MYTIFFYNVFLMTEVFNLLHTQKSYGYAVNVKFTNLTHFFLMQNVMLAYHNVFISNHTNLIIVI